MWKAKLVSINEQGINVQFYDGVKVEDMTYLLDDFETKQDFIKFIKDTLDTKNARKDKADTFGVDFAAVINKDIK